ncbi:dihydroorotate dehydrogenase [Methanobrevibacter filiformis]|uniref:Dihydroorotate dehydrogenase n=1 Tax=Methanobrevibacter filiformis TaxID=55758 RepID=A0A166APN6_9EURY|nr:dihydroorotate dehydrogenase [Methanobrevibacter filiformis]KZX12309.1 dihydroorotate dehydrogenase B (NAD(+)), catalytic subunit [Methanobrevibacter filiformis]
MLKTKLCGHRLNNPLLLAAGVMGSNASSMNWILESGAAGVVTKSFSKEANKGYNNPTTVEVTGGIINAIGLSSPGVESFKEELKKINKDVNGNTKNNGKIAIASIYGSNPEEFSFVSSEIEDLVDMIELNISCPHAMKGCGAAIGQDPNLTYKIVSKVKNSVKIPIIAKLTPNVTDIGEIAISAENGGADALTLINSLGPGMKIDITTGRPILHNKFGGMSGPAIKPIALKHVYNVYESVNIPIIGVGGIRNYADVIEFLYAGSSAVQIGTSILYDGPSIFNKINNDLGDFIKSSDFSSIKEMIGIAHRN